MIHVSSYWKEDLIKLADKLLLRMVQKRWGEKNFFTLEKEIFLGFYSVRKLIESKKVSEKLTNKSYVVQKLNFVGDPEVIIPKSADSDFNLIRDAEKSSLTTVQICNQIIHSYHFIPFFPNGKNLIGFFFCSDFERKKCLYLITIFEVSDIFKTIGQNYPNRIAIERLENGKFKTAVE